MKRLILFILLMCTFPVPVGAEPPGLTLAQALQTSMREHPSLKRLQENRQAALSRERSSASDLHPKIAWETMAKDGPTGAPGLGLTGLVNSIIVDQVGTSVLFGASSGTVDSESPGKLPVFFC